MRAANSHAIRDPWQGAADLGGTLYLQGQDAELDVLNRLPGPAKTGGKIVACRFSEGRYRRRMS